MPEKDAHTRSHIQDAFSYGIIYVYSIPLPSWAGRLKIGVTTTNIPNPSQKDIEAAAIRNRIKPQTQTADLPYKLEYAELAVTNSGEYFSDQQVHDVLTRSGFPRKAMNTTNSRSEWFEVNLEIAKTAIKAVKEGRSALSTKEKTTSNVSPFQFRPN